MADTADLLEAARDAYRRRDWVAARAHFGAARAEEPLGAEDLYALSNCAWWLGDLDEALPVQQEVYRLHIDADQRGPAALVAMDIGYTLSIRGEEAQGSGWLSRAVRLLEDQPEGVEHGYLDYVLGFEAALAVPQLDEGLEAARRIHGLGQRFGDPTLTALGVLGQGRVLVKQGQVAEGMAMLDEAMVAAVSDELDPAWAGNIYCHLMVACDEIADLRRAAEWTEVVARWCERMPGAGPFMGICRVHRARTLQVRGDWTSAEREAVRVCEELARFDVEIVAEAHYQLGDLRRQRGDLAGAEAAFQAGHRLGRDPQPGLALVRLAGGEVETASASISSALAAAADERLVRARLLPAAVEIDLAAGDLDRARAASDELAEIASTYGTTGFAAQARQAHGSVLLAEGAVAQALTTLRHALRTWQELGSPYAVATVRILLARAYDELGDRDAARLEQAAAQAEFARLGAGPGGAGRRRPDRTGGLTAREAQVLGLVAAGKSNQQIAAELVLSIRTVERHLATVYDKLGVHGRSARAAAVSHALREGILA
jgi:DNA-binding NarL/FixJ family response regulator